MSRNADRRLRFSVEQDMQLLKEVVKQNPFEDLDRWWEVHENFVNECNVPFSMRTCKDHANHLLNLHLKDSLKLRPRELPEDFEKKKKYLDQILEMRKNFCSENTHRRGPRSLVYEDSINEATIKKEEPKTEDSDDDFYWEEENERDKREKEREANDVDGKLRKQELALEEREVALKEKCLKLEEERFELDRLERNRRTEMEKAEREAYRNVAMQNQTIITALMDTYNRRNGGNNLCIL